jgi:hypothetical protein
MLPLSGVKVFVGWALPACPNTEQRPERTKRGMPPVKAKSEFVQIGLQMLRADAVMRPTKPGFQVQENEANHRKILFGCFAALDETAVLVAPLRKRCVTWADISHNYGPRLDRSLNEAAQRVCIAILNDFHPQSSRITRTETGRRRTLFWLPPQKLNGCYYQSLVYPVAATRCSADPRLVHLDVVLLAEITADAAVIGADHSGPQFVQDLESCFVSGEADLPLKLNSRKTWRQA